MARWGLSGRFGVRGWKWRSGRYGGTAGQGRGRGGSSIGTQLVRALFDCVRSTILLQSRPRAATVQALG